MKSNMKKTVSALLLFTLFCIFGVGPAAFADVQIEADPNIHDIMGDLYTLSAAMHLYYEDARKTQAPTVEQLSAYLQPHTLPQDWKDLYRVAEMNSAWWIGRKVPDFSQARRFLRNNAELLGIFDRESMKPWLGGAFVWFEGLHFEGSTGSPKAVLLDMVAAPGEGKDAQHLFFNSPGTEYFWWSNLFFSDKARSRILKRFGGMAPQGTYLIPPALQTGSETFTASPVSLPPDFTVSGDEEDNSHLVEMGDVLFNPIPRTRSGK